MNIMADLRQILVSLYQMWPYSFYPGLNIQLSD